MLSLLSLWLLLGIRIGLHRRGGTAVVAVTGLATVLLVWIGLLHRSRRCGAGLAVRVGEGRRRNGATSPLVVRIATLVGATAMVQVGIRWPGRPHGSRGRTGCIAIAWIMPTRMLGVSMVAATIGRRRWNIVHPPTRAGGDKMLVADAPRPRRRGAYPAGDGRRSTPVAVLAATTATTAVYARAG